MEQTYTLMRTLPDERSKSNVRSYLQWWNTPVLKQRINQKR